jgi:cytoskeletal protein CcmA (bactofilin family)
MFGIGGKTDTLLGQGAEFKGNINVEGGIVIDGKVEGNVSASERITVGLHGNVRGNLSAPEVVVGGKVDGNVLASDRAELLATAHVDGDIKAVRMVMVDGASLTGKVGMADAGGASDAPEYKFARK